MQLEVNFPPNSSSPPHRHGGANVFAFVADGEITSAMNEGDAKVYKKGETWYEAPGCKYALEDPSPFGQSRLIGCLLMLVCRSA